MQMGLSDHVLKYGFKRREFQKKLSLIGIHALCHISSIPWWPNWDSDGITVLPMIQIEMGMLRIAMQLSNVLWRCTALFAQMSWTTCNLRLNTHTMQWTTSISRFFHLRKIWDLCQWFLLVCCYRLSVPTDRQKVAWKQTKLLNRWCQISACWESCWKKWIQGWFWKQISLVTRTISICQIEFFLTPGPSQLGVQILLIHCWQISIADSFNCHFADQFALPKPSVPMLSYWTPQLTGQCTLNLISPIWKD